MRLPTVRAQITAFTLSVVLLLLTSTIVTAQAPATILTLTVPDETAIGESVELQASLTRDGIPVQDAEVVFLRTARFLNTGNDIEIGSGLTDAAGKVAVLFAPRSEGDLLILAEFEGSDFAGYAFAEGGIHVATGPPQYVEEAGIKVPGINVSLLVAVLTTIWGTFLFVMLLVWRIAREGSFSTIPEEAVSE